MTNDVENEVVNRLAESKSFDFFVEKTVLDKLSSLGKRYKFFLGFVAALLLLVLGLLGYKTFDLDQLIGASKTDLKNVMGEAQAKITDLDNTKSSYQSFTEQHKALLNQEKEILTDRENLFTSQAGSLTSRVELLTTQVNSIETAYSEITQLKKDANHLVDSLEIFREDFKEALKDLKAQGDQEFIAFGKKLDSDLMNFRSQITTKLEMVDSVLGKLQRRISPLKAISLSEEGSREGDFRFGDDDELEFELKRRTQQEKQTVQPPSLIVKINGRALEPLSVRTAQLYPIQGTRYLIEVISSSEIANKSGSKSWRVEFIIAIADNSRS